MTDPAVSLDADYGSATFSSAAPPEPKDEGTVFDKIVDRVIHDLKETGSAFKAAVTQEEVAALKTSLRLGLIFGWRALTRPAEEDKWVDEVLIVLNAVNANIQLICRRAAEEGLGGNPTSLQRTVLNLGIIGVDAEGRFIRRKIEEAKAE